MARLSLNEPTDKQLSRIRQIINHVGEERVVAYLHTFAGDQGLATMTKRQAQRLIIGLDNLLPTRLVFSRRNSL